MAFARWSKQSSFDPSKDEVIFEADEVRDPEYPNVAYHVSLKSYDGATPKVAIEKTIDRANGNTERVNLGRIPTSVAADIAAAVVECVEMSEPHESTTGKVAKAAAPVIRQAEVALKAKRSGKVKVRK